MKILFDIVHPAHFHLFKNFIYYLKKGKHTIVITSRNKDVLNMLLAESGLSYYSLSSPKKKLLSMFVELLKRDLIIYFYHWKFKFDIAFGTSISIAHLSILTKVKSFNFNEDDDSVVPLYALLSYPFSTRIMNPSCLKFTKFIDKRVLFQSYHELAYLHPNNFKPDQKILSKYNLKKHFYIVIRLSALTAHHVREVKGINSQLIKEIIDLTSKFQIIYSRENDNNTKINPVDMHHILAFAKMVISDSQTTTAEAAVLGVPSIRYNSFVGKISYLNELEYDYDLTYGFLPGQEREMLAKIKQLLFIKNIHKIWNLKKRRMLKVKIDLNTWMINYFEKSIKLI